MDQLIIFAVLVALGYMFGTHSERKHLKSIREREESFSDLPVIMLKRPIDDESVQRHELVNGNAVIAIDYFKRFIASLVNIFGGRISTYESLVDRARREALLRMKEDAGDAAEIINVRIETSSISKSAQKSIGAVEVLAYGTAIYKKMTKQKPDYKGSLPDHSVNISHENPLLVALKLTVALALIVAIGYFLIYFLINKAVDMITPEQEIEIQKLFDKNITETKSAKLNTILAKVSRCADLPFKVKLHIDRTDEINAFAMPGGYIYLTRGILDKISSENELAFVLGHELGHFKHKDHLRSMGFRLTISLITHMLGANYGSATSIPLTISSAKYSQSEEFAADEYGLEVMNCAYGTVNGAVQMFEKMDDGIEWMHFVATHPGFKERIKEMKRIAAEKGYDISKKMVPIVRLETKNLKLKTKN